MISGGIDVNYFAHIRVILEAKFGANLLPAVLCFSILPCKQIPAQRRQ